MARERIRERVEQRRAKPPAVTEPSPATAFAAGDQVRTLVHGGQQRSEREIRIGVGAGGSSILRRAQDERGIVWEGAGECGWGGTQGVPSGFGACPCASADSKSQSPATSAAFLARLHPLIRRSAAKASSRVGKGWDQSSTTGRRNDV